jgi:ribosomal protein S18 acetylase RimI-like enzyme
MSAKPPVTVRAATLSDLPRIVAIHEAAFTGFFLTLLGRRFLRELYHGFITDSSGICLVCEAELAAGQRELAGFVVGTVAPESFFRGLLLRRGARFVMAAVPALVMHPLKVAPRLLHAVRYRGDRPMRVQAAALLSSVGVHPQAARRGIGRTLIDQFCEHAARRGAGQVYLTTDREANEAANTLYERAGFAVADELVRRDGRVMNLYVRVLAGRGDAQREAS